VNCTTTQSVATQREWYPNSQDNPITAAASAACQTFSRITSAARYTHTMVSALTTKKRRRAVSK
jgi:hypothetical protein